MSNPSDANCPRCGTALPARAPEGLCPRCLGALNLAADTVPTGADAIAAQPPLTPAELAPHFPQLEILECLGRGGMGVVYKARQKSLNRVVALKLLAPERVTDAGFAERFTREAQALAALNHPNIVTIYDFGTTRASAGGLQPPPIASSTTADGDYKSPAPSLSTLNPQLSTPPSGFFFLLMEFVDGVNLRQAMKAGRFTPEQALAIVPPVCEALQYAHEHGIVHRDIKPENLLLDKDGRVKIADFGIAKMLGDDGRTVPRAGDLQSPPAASDATDGDCKSPAQTIASVAGTPQYMAPEQRDHQRTDHRADIYSLGVVLYELLTGELPADKLQPPSRKVQIDVRLDEIVLRALEQTPELRYQTAAELRTQVEAVTMTPAGGHIEKTPPSTKQSASSEATGLAAATVCFFAGVVGGGVLVSLMPFRFDRDFACFLLVFLVLAVSIVAGVLSSRALRGPLQPRGWLRALAIAASVLALPVLGFAAYFLYSMSSESGSWNPTSSEALLVAITFLGTVMLPWAGAHLWRAALPPAPGSTPAAKAPVYLSLGFLCVLLALLPVLLPGFLFLQFSYKAPALFGSAPSVAITNVAHTVMGSSNTVLFTELEFRVEGTEPVELRVEFTGPELPGPVARALAQESPDHGRLFASLRAREHNALLLEPERIAARQPRVHFQPGAHKWQIGFAFPLEKITWQARGNFRPPVTRLAPSSKGEHAWEFFAVSSDNNATYRARLVARRSTLTVSGQTGAAAARTDFALGWRAVIAIGVVALGFGGVVLLVWLLRKGGGSTRTVLLVLAVPFVLLALAVAALIGWKAMRGMKLEKFERMQLTANPLPHNSPVPPGLVQQTQNGFRLQLPAGQLASFELHIRQADNSTRPVPALTALVAAGTNAAYHDSLYWTLRRAEPPRANGLTDQLWFWSVTAHDGHGRALAQRTDHGTNFTHSVAPGDTLDWWPLALPSPLTFAAGEIKDITLLRTHGTATARGGHPKEAFLRVRCTATPTGFVTDGTPRIELGLAAHALLTGTLTAKNVAAVPPHIEFKALRVENPPGTRDILLHFERDTNAALGLEVWQDVTPSPGLHKQPSPGTYLDSQMRTWLGVNHVRVLRWTLPNEFTEAEVRAVVKDIEERAKVWRALDEGHVLGVTTVTHRDGWKYHLVATVKRTPGSEGATATTPKHQ